MRECCLAANFSRAPEKKGMGVEGVEGGFWSSPISRD